MTQKSNIFKSPVILLANGMFPTHPFPLSILESAGTVLCTDGAADALIEKGLHPHIIIGDLDSTTLAKDSFKGLVIHIQEQENTDMAKALNWCKINGLKKMTILGATEKRDDHALTNFFLLAAFSEDLDLELVTDFFTITAHSGEKTFESFPGQLISLIPTSVVESISTYGLEYPLKKESLSPSSRGVSNVATGSTFTVESSHKVWVFRSHPEK